MAESEARVGVLWYEWKIDTGEQEVCGSGKKSKSGYCGFRTALFNSALQLLVSLNALHSQEFSWQVSEEKLLQRQKHFN